LGGTAVSAIARPWVGVVVSYLFILLTPQNIWWWHFGDVRPVYWILLPTIIGTIFGIASKKINPNNLKTRQNLYLLILWICFNISYLFGSYVNVYSGFSFKDVGFVYPLINKIFVLYFIAILNIDSEKKLKCLCLVLVVSATYMIYWANAQYLFEGRYGRIGGPTDINGGSIYRDENCFAMLFICGLPFLYYMGWFLKNKIIRYSLWLVIPFGWHAIFLTGSRGGLLSLCVCILLATYRSHKKKAVFLMIPIFAVAYVWQAGDIMRNRAKTIKEYETESSAATRLEAWSAAINMIENHPLIGVGIASFGAAFPDYSIHTPREAHNTFFQITAESGLIAGLMYLLIIVSNIRILWKNGKNLKYNKKTDLNGSFVYFFNEAALVSFVGLIVGSLFLSFQTYEIFYFLCLLINSIYLRINNEQNETIIL